MASFARTLFLLAVSVAFAATARAAWHPYEDLPTLYDAASTPFNQYATSWAFTRTSTGITWYWVVTDVSGFWDYSTGPSSSEALPESGEWVDGGYGSWSWSPGWSEVATCLQPGDYPSSSSYYSSESLEAHWVVNKIPYLQASITYHEIGSDFYYWWGSRYTTGTPSWVGGDETPTAEIEGEGWYDNGMGEWAYNGHGPYTSMPSEPPPSYEPPSEGEWVDDYAGGWTWSGSGSPTSDPPTGNPPSYGSWVDDEDGGWSWTGAFEPYLTMPVGHAPSYYGIATSFGSYAGHVVPFDFVYGHAPDFSAYPGGAVSDLRQTSSAFGEWFTAYPNLDEYQGMLFENAGQEHYGSGSWFDESAGGSALALSLPHMEKKFHDPLDGFQRLRLRYDSLLELGRRDFKLPFALDISGVQWQSEISTQIDEALPWAAMLHTIKSFVWWTCYIGITLRWFSNMLGCLEA